MIRDVRRAVLILGLVSVSALAGCSAVFDAEPPAPDPFDEAVDTVVIEVDYGVNAAPYTGSAGVFSEVWDLARINAERMFDPDTTVVVPTELAQMERLGDVIGATFTTAEILDIADEHRSPVPAGTASYYVLFVDGVLEDAAGPRSDVLGLSIGDTGVIAMFKPVIRMSEGSLEVTSRFVEQSTLVHELGHAVGLVNNGIPATTAHHDAQNGAHCSNRDCVMYFANEGLADMLDFVLKAVTSGDPILFGDDCLADIDAMRQVSTP